MTAPALALLLGFESVFRPSRFVPGCLLKNGRSVSTYIIANKIRGDHRLKRFPVFQFNNTLSRLFISTAFITTKPIDIKLKCYIIGSVINERITDE